MQKIFSLSEVVNQVKMKFSNAIRDAVLEINGAKQVFAGCFDKEGLIATGLENLIQEKWQNTMNGVLWCLFETGNYRKNH